MYRWEHPLPYMREPETPKYMRGPETGEMRHIWHRELKNEVRCLRLQKGEESFPDQ